MGPATDGGLPHSIADHPARQVAEHIEHYMLTQQPAKHRKSFLVLARDQRGGIAKYPMKQWLREHPESLPVGVSPKDKTSRQLGGILKKLGWTVEERDESVELTAPSAPAAGTTATLPEVSKVKKEFEFGEHLADRLRGRISGELEIDTFRSLLYAVAFDDEGNLTLGLNSQGEPVRGRGTGFEQDVVIFRRTTSGQTSITPRVVIELKFGGVTTHDTIVYSEKARRIKAIYPFARYGLVIGKQAKIPPRVLRLGSEFDFVVAVDAMPTKTQEDHLVALLAEEVGLAEGMTRVLNGNTHVRSFRRKLEIE